MIESNESFICHHFSRGTDRQIEDIRNFHAVEQHAATQTKQESLFFIISSASAAVERTKN
jgi:hypothetical protein